jgi:hypothetical protein
MSKIRFPLEVTICPTDKLAWQLAGPGASEEAMLYTKGYEMSTQEIECWEDLELPEGYEIHDEDVRKGFREYLKGSSSSQVEDSAEGEQYE